MSLTVPPDLLEQAGAGEVDDAEFLDCVAASLPYAWDLVAGLVRELEALAPMRFTLLTERRRRAPRGRDGGAPGATGENLLDGKSLPSKSEGNLAPGSRLRLETPGGGGHGLP